MINYISFLVPLYPCRIHLYVGDNIQEVVDTVSKKFLLVFNDDLGLIDGYASKRDGNMIIMIKRGASYTRCITHECLHTVHKILAFSKAFPAFDNDESECYLMSWLCERVVSEITKMGKKNKEKRRVKDPAKRGTISKKEAEAAVSKVKEKK